MTGHTVTLPSGVLTLDIERTSRPLDTLLDYAVRRNPKRGFLFVSRVLGKHLPIRPAVAAEVHRELAAALPPLRRPHFIGLAETATALGEGVFRAWQELSGRLEEATAEAPGAGEHTGTFQHSTRYALDRPVLLRFDEPHSHAPAHILYDPGAAAHTARELVLVDDELSTGTTLQNLAAAWLAQCPGTERVVMVSLTDWCPRHEEIRAALGVPVEFVALLDGRYAFAPAPDWQPPQLPAVTGTGTDKSALLPADGPRLGGEWRLAPALTPQALGLSGGGRVLVLGQGEFQYPAFALARRLEAAGLDVRWSATTRSPILPGLAVRQALEFTDNVGDGMPNYLYNVDPAEYSRVLVTYEGAARPDAALLEALGPHAEAVQLA
ncbi:MAG: phosphoribosyltransferase domain-containing protein [Deinococcus sp.]|nr:phosphoribosyltransferase domain-containing protein [Deinococcus sp.]